MKRDGRYFSGWLERCSHEAGQPRRRTVIGIGAYPHFTARTESPALPQEKNGINAQSLEKFAGAARGELLPLIENLRFP